VIRQADYYSLAGFFNQMDEGGLASASRGTPRGTTLEWPTALQSEKLAEARANTAAKEAAYQNALRAAQQKAAAALAAMSDGERSSFLEASIKADAQAYYPLDSGYTGDFSSIYVEPPEPLKGIPVEGEKNPFDGLPRAQVTTFLQKKILADVQAGKPTPMLGRAEAAAVSPFGRRAVMAGDLAAMQADPGLPRLASREVEWAMEQLIASGYTDNRLGMGSSRITERRMPQWVHPEALQWTDSGLGDGKNGFVSNVKFVPGHKGDGIQLRDSVFAADKSVGMFERTQPYSLDFWLKLRTEPYVDTTRPNGPSASILYNNGVIEGQGYELSLANGKLSYSIIHLAPHEMLQVSTRENIPTGRWVHITSTYDGNSNAAGMHL
jgi:hypothetical protein